MPLRMDDHLRRVGVVPLITAVAFEAILCLSILAATWLAMGAAIGDEWPGGFVRAFADRSPESSPPIKGDGESPINNRWATSPATKILAWSRT